jgi:hypothetical protein
MFLDVATDTGARRGEVLALPTIQYWPRSSTGFESCIGLSRSICLVPPPVENPAQTAITI